MNCLICSRRMLGLHSDNNIFWSSFSEMCPVSAVPFFPDPQTHTHTHGIIGTAALTVCLIPHYYIPQCRGDANREKKQCKIHKTWQVWKQWPVEGMVQSNRNSLEDGLALMTFSCNILNKVMNMLNLVPRTICQPVWAWGKNSLSHKL